MPGFHGLRSLGQAADLQRLVEEQQLAAHRSGLQVQAARGPEKGIGRGGQLLEPPSCFKHIWGLAKYEAESEHLTFLMQDSPLCFLKSQLAWGALDMKQHAFAGVTHLLAAHSWFTTRVSRKRGTMQISHVLFQGETHKLVEVSLSHANSMMWILAMAPVNESCAACAAYRARFCQQYGVFCSSVSSPRGFFRVVCLALKLQVFVTFSRK